MTNEEFMNQMAAEEGVSSERALAFATQHACAAEKAWSFAEKERSKHPTDTDAVDFWIHESISRVAMARMWILLAAAQKPATTTNEQPREMTRLHLANGDVSFVAMADKSVQLVVACEEGCSVGHTITEEDRNRLHRWLHSWLGSRG